MKKILFLIHDLGPGGAEKVLVNLVNNMDHRQFHITVMTLFDVGVNKQFLSPEVRYKTCFHKMIPGNAKWMKLMTPKQLHKRIIQEHYDIEVSYLEGPCARIISGCTDPGTKKVCWIHIEQGTKKRFASSFRSYKEAAYCYNCFDRIIAVSETVKSDFLSFFKCKVPIQVLYNVNETDKIKKLALKPVRDPFFAEEKNEFRIVGVGKILKNKGFDRLARIQKRLLDEGYHTCVYILGEGPERTKIEKYAMEQHIDHKLIFLGYQTNPYQYVARCDLFVCSSYAEGFSTAATEALIVGTPVCTVEVSGMKEMLGEHNECGIVTKNDEESLYRGIKTLLDDKSLWKYYKEKAIERGRAFDKEQTVKACEDMLLKM